MNITEFARLAIDVPFLERGRGWRGWDCWGLIQAGHREILGVSLPSYAEGYRDTGHSAESRRRLAALLERNKGAWRRVLRPRACDVVLLNIAGRPIHVGLAIDAGLMLHAEARIDTVIERLASPMWARRIEGFYRYAG